jgi:glyoxylase-like metal-dependent hydrolase (beta-lactamase superfamily II)
MIYAARTDSGVIVIDLGWTGSEDVLASLTGRLGATPADVRFVFLTHAHRDHIAAWPLVRQARFIVGAAEIPAFTGDAHYAGWANKVGDELNEYPRPRADELVLVPVAADTTIPLGRDTVFAFPIPGHTPGSTAYLFVASCSAVTRSTGARVQGSRARDRSSRTALPSAARACARSGSDFRPDAHE